MKEGEVNIGGNPSAEEQEEALENGAQQVNNVVHSHRLQKTVFDKKSYLTHLKVRQGYTRLLFRASFSKANRLCVFLILTSLRLT